MIIHQVLDTVTNIAPFDHSYLHDLAAPGSKPGKGVSGPELASNARKFFAPVAAVLIGIVALKFLFGENKSLAGFIGFLVLAIVVFALINWGENILDALSSTVANWTSNK